MSQQLTESEARNIIEAMRASRQDKDALMRQWIERRQGARFVVCALRKRQNQD